ncbi:MAG: hypothetical protein KDD52_09285, partial [Bdellovibrionales bacterium]|nr:hypothetical protein [Bdellovibrionales bacterium]
AQKEAQEFAHQSDWQFPILNDKDNSIKNSFGAHSSTPEFFLYDQRGHLLTHQTLTLPNLTTGARHLFPEKVPY